MDEINSDSEEDILADQLVSEEVFKTQFSLLAREYELNRFIAHPDRSEHLEEMDILWDEMESSIESIKDALTSDALISDGSKSGLSHSEALLELLIENKQIESDIVHHFQRLQTSSEEYKLAADKLNLAIAKLKASMTLKVQEQSSKAINYAKNATRLVLIATSVGVFLCFIVLWFALQAIIKPIHSVSRQLWDIAEGDGDLSIKLPEDNAKEISELAVGFNHFTDKLEDVLNQLKHSTKYLCNTTIEITSVGNATENAVGNQHQQIDSIASTMADLSSNIESVAEQTETASGNTQTANTEVQKSQNILLEAIYSIQQVEQEVQNVAQVLNILSSDIENISEILDVIRSISDQTNLLALNAAIEAARAGSYGRGFAVVADEVRGLAQRTNTSIEEIESKIDHLQSSSDKALSAMENAFELSKRTVVSANQAGDSLSNATALIAGISSTTENIATATRGQSSSATSIQQSTEELRQSATASSFSAKDLSESTANLVNLASELSNLAAQYRTSKESESSDKDELLDQTKFDSGNITEDEIDDVLF